jgi:hypothetical protein
MRRVLILAAVLFSTVAGAHAYTPYGTYYNPVQDPPFVGDWSVPVHRGMYCVKGTWHYGWLRPWERSPVIKDSCGTAVYQIN